VRDVTERKRAEETQIRFARDASLRAEVCAAFNDTKGYCRRAPRGTEMKETFILLRDLHRSIIAPAVRADNLLSQIQAI